MKRHAADDVIAANFTATQFLARIVRANTIAAKVLESRRPRHRDSPGAAYRHRFRHPQWTRLRNNEPAEDWYFVPGSMVLKNELLADAFSRLLKTETNYKVRMDDARLIGAFEHFYKNNRFGNSDYGTHYVVLGYELKVPDAAEPEPAINTENLRWWPLDELLGSDRVHKNTKAYFRR
jgi:colanic acid biosynthesis protein WcaH